MNSEDNKSPENDLRKRIVNLIRANEQARKRQIAGDELEKLKSAAARLGQMLRAATDADCQTLRSAATKLDQLLTDIRKGKDVSTSVKRNENNKDQKDPL